MSGTDIFRILILFPPMIALGMVACIAGRLSLVRLANGRYRGSFAAWMGYLGGTFLALLGAFGMAAVGLWGLIR